MKSIRHIPYLLVLFVVVLGACAPGGGGARPGTSVSPVSTGVIVQHQATPGQLPGQRSSHAGDQDSSPMADKKRAPGGDRFTFDQFERPFNAETMDVYFPYLDIQDVSVYQDDSWVYAVLTLKATDANGALPGRYAVELDLNADGRGEWLLLVEHPASADWSTDGVKLWTDRNGDVGGDIVGKSDKAVTDGDGYETLVLPLAGSDPDAAWARIPREDPHTVQLAVKQSLLGGDHAYLAGMWTGNEDLNPALFDLSDHFTHEQAGAALPELEYYYPIKQLSELDNTCRMAVGFEPTGNEPGLCASSLPGGPEGCLPYGHSCGLRAECCDGVPCTAGFCRYP
jgi:hypothetical protein